MKNNKHRKPTTKQLFSVADENAPFTYVEAYKMLCTNLEFITAAQDCKKLMITSTLANEGKTNVSVNLALTLAGYEKKVCLVECDLRRPSVHRFLKANRNSEGLTNVLKGEVELKKAIKNVSGTSMDILLSGSTPPNPSELLASNKMKELIDELEGMYLELEDRFGPIPDEVYSLLSLAEVRVIAKKLFISSIKERQGLIQIEFGKVSNIKVDRVLKLIKETAGKVKLDPTKPNMILMQAGKIGLKEKSEFIREKLEALV